MLKVGIIGCGNIFTMHATSAHHLDNAKIVAVCDIKKDRADIRWVLGHVVENYVQTPALGVVLVLLMGSSASFPL